MMARRTFGTKLAGGFGLTVALTLLMGAASVTALIVAVTKKDAVITRAADSLTGTEQLNTTAENRISDYRAYLLNGQQEYLDLTNADRTRFLDLVSRLRGTLTDPTELSMLNAVSTTEATHAAVLAPVIQKRQTITDLHDVAQLGGDDLAPARQKLEQSIADLIDRVRADVERARKESTRTTSQAIVVVIILGGLSIVSTAILAVVLSRRLRHDVGTAVGHIQSSSSQLEAAAAQQAAGGRPPGSSPRPGPRWSRSSSGATGSWRRSAARCRTTCAGRCRSSAVSPRRCWTRTRSRSASGPGTGCSASTPRPSGWPTWWSRC
jgi:CHASE3 domain sensor protein